MENNLKDILFCELNRLDLKEENAIKAYLVGMIGNAYMHSNQPGFGFLASYIESKTLAELRKEIMSMTKVHDISNTNDIIYVAADNLLNEYMTKKGEEKSMNVLKIKRKKNN